MDLNKQKENKKIVLICSINIIAAYKVFLFPNDLKKKMFYEPHISLNLFCELCTFSEALVPCERNKYQFCHQNNKLQP